jgi:hypothetical protein
MNVACCEQDPWLGTKVWKFAENSHHEKTRGPLRALLYEAPAHQWTRFLGFHGIKGEVF